MLHDLNEEKWKKALEKDSKLKDLAQKAGVENNFERVKELNGCYAWNCGRDVVKSEDERILARYLFCKTDSNIIESTIKGRIIAANLAKIDISDL